MQGPAEAGHEPIVAAAQRGHVGIRVSRPRRAQQLPQQQRGRLLPWRAALLQGEHQLLHMYKDKN